jgi:zinc transport system substrate-binding protein
MFMKRLTAFLFVALFFVILAGGCGGGSSNAVHDDAPTPKDRPLSDFAGEWTSGVPFIESGELDEFITNRAASNGMTYDETKELVLKVWKTDYDNLTVSNNKVTIGGESADYAYVQYSVIESEGHDTAIWYVYTTNDERFPKYMMFSDHGDGNEDEHDDGHDHDHGHGVAHMHIKYGDDDFQSILDPSTNWSPMYFDAHASADEILEMLLGH